MLGASAVPPAGILFLALRELHTGVTPEQLTFYYVLPALALAGIAGAFLLPASAKVQAALLLLSFGVALVAAEVLAGVVIRLNGAPPEKEAAAPDSSILRIVLARRAAGERAYPKIPGNVLVDSNPEFPAGGRTLHPLTPGPGHATIVLCNQDGPVVEYRSDWLGFNNPQGAWSTGGPEVLLIGDSYTHGVCVRDRHQLATRLRSTRNVLNLGVSGAGPLMELAILREYGATLTPPLVVWVYYEGNDLWDLNRARRRDWLTAYLDASHGQDLLGHRDVVDARYRAWVDSLVAAEDRAAGAASERPPRPDLLSDVARFASLRRLVHFGVLFPDEEPPLGLLPSILRRARDDVAAWGGRLVVVYMPAYERYDTWVGEGLAGRRELLALTRALGIPVVDLDPVFEATGDPRSLWAGPTGHLAPEGYRIAARAIDAALDSLSP